MELVVSAIIALIVVGLIGYPLLKEQAGDDEPQALLSEEAEELYRRKESTYSALKELEFDYKTGKLSEVDYRELEARYRAEAIEVLEAIEAFEATGKVGGTRAAKRAAAVIDEVLPPIDDDVEVVEAAPRRGRKTSSRVRGERAAACAECGATHNPPGARFCGACGASLAAQASGSPNGDGDGEGREPAVCDECGASVEPEHRFCGSCGAEVRA